LTGRNIQHLSYRIPQVNGLFTKYARAGETQILPGATGIWQQSYTPDWK